MQSRLRWKEWRGGALYYTWMQTAASLIRTNCFLSSRALNRRCSMTMSLRTSLWRKACSCWRSASRRNTWEEEPWWSQYRASTLIKTKLQKKKKKSITSTQTCFRKPWMHMWSQECQEWPSNYIDTIPETCTSLSCPIHTLDKNTKYVTLSYLFF